MREFGSNRGELNKRDDLEEEEIYRRERGEKIEINGSGRKNLEFGYGGELGGGIESADKKISNLEKEKKNLNHARRVEAFRADLYRDNPMWSLFKSNTEQSKQMLEMAKSGGLIDFEKELKKVEENLVGMKEIGQSLRESGVVYIDDETKMEINKKLISELMAIKIALEGEMDYEEE